MATGTPLSQMTYWTRRHFQVVPGPHQRHDQPGLHRYLLAQRLDPVQQVTATGGVHQIHEVERDLEFQRVNPHLLGDGLGGMLGCRLLLRFGQTFGLRRVIGLL